MKYQVYIFFVFCFFIFNVTASGLEDNKDSSNKKIVSSYQNVLGREAILNDSNVRLRSESNLHGRILMLLKKGDKVIILDRSEKKERINDMNAFWYKIRTINGDEGWMYGEFLDIGDKTFEIGEVQLEKVKTLINYNLDKLLVNINNINPKIPEIKSNIDRTVYTRLVGIYSYNEPKIPSVYKNVYQDEYSWGIDYNFGRGTYSIDYIDGIWHKDGDGEEETFKIKSYDGKSLVIDWGMHTTPRFEKCTLIKEFFETSNCKLFKYSGPENQFYYLKKIINYRQEEMRKYSLLSSDEAKKEIGDLPLLIYKLIKENEFTSLIKLVASNLEILFIDGKNVDLPINQNGMDNADFKENVAVLTSELNNKYCPDFNKAAIIYNKYLVVNLDEIQKKYSNSITVELYENEYSYLGLVFIKENGKWKLAYIIDHVLDFA